MAIEAPNSKEHAGTPHGKGKNAGGFVTVECLLLFDTDEDKKKVLGLMRKFSSMVRFAYKRLIRKMEEKELESCYLTSMS